MYNITNAFQWKLLVKLIFVYYILIGDKWQGTHYRFSGLLTDTVTEQR